MQLIPLRHDSVKSTDPMGESLLESVKPFKVWIPQAYGVVLGNSQKVEKECNIAALQADNIPLYKRRGGGGTVLLSPKGFCYGIRFEKIKHKQIHDYFYEGNQVLTEVLKEYNIEACSKGISDVAVLGKKVLGCSLYMPKNSVLYLASVLVENDLEAIEKYLVHPSREPDYRQGRVHSEFLTNINTLSDGQISLKKIVHDVKINLESKF
jgi:lipoate-protein ligase A